MSNKYIEIAERFVPGKMSFLLIGSDSAHLEKSIGVLLDPKTHLTQEAIRDYPQYLRVSTQIPETVRQNLSFFMKKFGDLFSVYRNDYLGDYDYVERVKRYRKNLRKFRDLVLEFQPVVDKLNTLKMENEDENIVFSKEIETMHGLCRITIDQYNRMASEFPYEK